MSGELKVNYVLLNQCISSLEALIDDESVSTLIDDLDSVFSNSSSKTTDALKIRYEEYSKVNEKLDAIATNVISVLKAAKHVYSHADVQLTSELTSSVGAAKP